MKGMTFISSMMKFNIDTGYEHITFKIKSWFIHVLSFIAFIFHSSIPFISRNSSRIPLLQVVACFIVGNPGSISLLALTARSSLISLY